MLKIFVLISLVYLMGSPIYGNAFSYQGQVCKTSSIVATTPSSRFHDNDNGTVTDSKTGLMWQKCIEGRPWNSIAKSCSDDGFDFLGWAEALGTATTANSNGGFAGYTDWRVPSIKELASIIERQCYDPAINMSVFPDIYPTNFWSSSPSTDRFSYSAMYVDFYAGGESHTFKDYGALVRLVRGGQ